MSFRQSLYARLALGLIVILFFVGLVYVTSITYLFGKIQQSAIQDINRNLASNLLVSRNIVANGQLNKDALKQTFMEYMSINPSIEIYSLDNQGRILSFSAEPGKVKRQSVDIRPIREFLSGANFPLLGDDPRSLKDKKPFSAAPLPGGYLYVVLQGEALTQAQQAQSNHYLLSLVFPAVAGSLLLGLVIGLVLFRTVSSRLQKLQNKIKRFTDSGYQDISEQADLVPVQGKDEIAELERRFEEMKRHICEQWIALKQQDRLRREMVSSISHDLRTPLASAQGYMETLALKKDTLTEDEKTRYLEIAIHEARRLQQLIDQLFELVRLEARDTPVEFEEFSILELAYDVVNKFTLKARAKNIGLKIREDASDSMVLADIGLIERVLDNLIDNALRHSSPELDIWVDIQLIENRVCVSVSDEGVGISLEEQQLIFERFHRADNPERSQTGHAGLGLAIVKKIIELHQQKVWVESRLGEGARFSFTLPQASADSSILSVS